MHRRKLTIHTGRIDVHRNSFIRFYLLDYMHRQTSFLYNTKITQKCCWGQKKMQHLNKVGCWLGVESCQRLRNPFQLRLRFSIQMKGPHQHQLGATISINPSECSSSAVWMLSFLVIVCDWLIKRLISILPCRQFILKLCATHATLKNDTW